MDKTVRSFPEWFGDDKAPTRSGQFGRFVMVFAYVVFGGLLAVLILSYILPLNTVFATGGLIVVSFAWTIRNNKRIWDLVIGLKRHIKTNAFFDFTREIPSLTTPLLVGVLTLTVVNPDDTVKDSGLFGGITEQFDRLENFLKGSGGPLSKEDIEAAVRPVVQDEIAKLRKELDSESATVAVERFVVFPKSGSDNLVQFFDNAIFPLRFPNAEIESGPNADNFDIKQVNWKEGADGGTELTTSHDEDLRELLKILAPCTLDPVVLRISGFASSLQFSEYKEPEISDKLNLAVANLRGDVVFKRLETLKEEFETADKEDLFNPSNLDIDFHDHKTFEEMQSHRPFNDRPGELRENESEGLNRSAFVEIRSIGACKKALG